MKRYCHISLFRVGFLLMISLLLRNPLIYVLSFAYLLAFNIYDAIAYAMALFISSFLFSRNDLLPIGIVDYERNGYFVVNKFLYKAKAYGDGLKAGDVILFDDRFNDFASLAERTKGIIYVGNFRGKVIFSLMPKALIYQLIESFDLEISSLYRNMFYGFYDDYSQFYSFSLGFGGYYLTKTLIKRNRTIGTSAIIFLSLLFCFDIRYFLLLIDSYFHMERKELLGLKMIIIGIMNYSLYENTSIQFILFASFIGVVDTEFDFRTLFALFQSVLFGSFDVLHLFLYRHLLITRVLIYLLALFGLLFRPFQSLMIQSIALSDKVFALLSFEIRGSISLFSIIIFLILRKMISIRADLLLIMLLILSPFNRPFFSNIYIDVGQGDAVLFNCPFSACHVLYDTGSQFNYHKLKKRLLKEGIYEIDYLVISHSDNDHSGNIENLRKDFKVKRIIDEKESFAIGGIEFNNLDLGAFDNENDNSLVYDVSYHEHHILLTGDISSKAEAVLVKRFPDLSIDILKVSHHGSSTSSSRLFVSRIMPKHSIISTSGQYGHPDQNTIDILKQYQSIYHITKEDGDIAFVFTNICDYLKTSKGDFVIIK